MSLRVLPRWTAWLMCVLLVATTEGRDEAPRFDWGTQHVVVSEWWPGAMAGHDVERWQPGLFVWRPEITHPHAAIRDLQFGRQGTGNTGNGFTGLIDGQIDIAHRLELASFGRRGKTIHLSFVLHPAGNSIPPLVQGVIRAKRGLPQDPPAPVALEDAIVAGVTGRYVLFAAELPQDLPEGAYRIVVEVCDPEGKSLQKHDCPIIRRAPPVDPLDTLSDRALLAEYVRRGEAIRNRWIGPNDSGRGRIAAMDAYTAPQYVAWRRTGDEIVRRGERIVPLLLEMLAEEAVRNPEPASFLTAKFGFAPDLIQRLTKIRDPRAVPLLIRIMNGMEGRTNLLVRNAALDAVETMTYLTFLNDSVNGPRHDRMLAAHDVRTRQFARPVTAAELRELARLYTDWLGQHDRTPERFLPMARERARAALEGDDPVGIAHAVEFLVGRFHDASGHDDGPQRTADAIARLLTRHTPADPEAEYATRRLRSALARCGPAARPHLHLILPEPDATQSWSDFEALARIGGKQVVEHLIATLPHHRAAAEPMPTPDDLAEDLASRSTQARYAYLGYANCRFAVERLAGRGFEDDDAIAAWWATAKHLEPEQWLTQNLPPTLEQADAGDAKSQYLARQLLPDLPHGKRDLPFSRPSRRVLSSPFYEQPIAPYRVHWLMEHQAQLLFDPDHPRWTLPGGLPTLPGGRP